MQTKILSIEDGLDDAVGLIKNGEVVVFPTETVYGLGANALDVSAVRKIFIAKGRPMDNPLIVHVADFDTAESVSAGLGEGARKLMRAFMPGAITVIVEKSDLIPDEVSAGLPTVGIRFPAHEGARKFIKACGVPIAAPSANTSTKISPTSAEHVYEDMQGRVPLILDGGSCQVGIESTIVDMTADVPTVLRPGAITSQMLAEVLGEVKSFAGKIIVAKAPGMKYRHYAPSCPMAVADSALSAAEYYAECEKNSLKPVIVAKSGYLSSLESQEKFQRIDLGDSDVEVMKNIYAAMHEAEKNYGVIICEDFGDSGVAASVMNRINKASGGRRV